MKKDKFKSLGSLTKKGLLVLFLAQFALTGVLNAQAPRIWPAEISFNYDENSTSFDAVTIKKNADTDISAPEYIDTWENTKNENFAYIMGQSVRKIKVKFDSNNHTMNYLVKATVISGTGLGNVCEIFVASCDLDSKVFTIELQGIVPGYVGKHEFTWQWEATALPTTSPFCPIICVPAITEHTYYTLLASPKEPMDVPWTDVLDYACVWADGQSSENLIIGCVTVGAYNNLGKTYWGGGSHAVYPNFNLTGFFAQDWADCRDMSAVLQVFSNALGIQNIQVRRIDGQFTYKPILPIGKSNWESGIWNFHQVGFYNDVFDACLKLNQGNPRIPINESINGSYKNDLFQSGSWTLNNVTTYVYVY